jgi:hypothetical protein
VRGVRLPDGREPEERWAADGAWQVTPVTFAHDLRDDLDVLAHPRAILIGDTALSLRWQHLGVRNNDSTNRSRICLTEPSPSPA